MHSTLYDPSLTAMQLSPSYFCNPRPSSHHLSNPTSVYPVTIFHFLPPSKLMWPYGGYTFSECVQIISKLSDQLYSQTLVNFTIAIVPSCSFTILSICFIQPNFSNTSSKHIYFSSLSTSLPPCPCQYNTYGTITPSFSHLFVLFILFFIYTLSLVTPST